MNVNITLTLDETQLRQINTFMQSSATPATRATVRIWHDGMLRKALDSLPPPKAGRTRKAVAVAALLDDTAVAKSTMQQRIDAPLDAVCVHCNTTKDEHGKMGYLCPLSRTYNKKTSFTGR